MPALLSHYRPDFPIYCFTENEDVVRRLALYHGVTPLPFTFSATAEETFERCGWVVWVGGWGCRLWSVGVGCA